MRISDWSSDVCSSDLVVDGHLRWADDAILVNPDPDEHRVLHDLPGFEDQVHPARERAGLAHVARLPRLTDAALENLRKLKARSKENRPRHGRSEEHTSELQSLMRISYAVFFLKKKKQYTQQYHKPK